MNGYWRHQTRIGDARIIWNSATRNWRVKIDEEDLGGYDSPQAALDDLIGGHTFSHSRCMDTSTLSLPEELAEWEFVRAA